MYQNNDNMSEAFFQDFNIQWTHFKQYPPSFLLGYYLFIIYPHLPSICTPSPQNMLNVLWYIKVTSSSNALYCDKLALQSKLWRITKYHSSLNYLLFFAPEIKTIPSCKQADN